MPKLDPAEWRQVFTLLDTALELPEPARDEWLERLDGNGAALKGVLRELLSRHASRETDDFLRDLPKFTNVAGGGGSSTRALQAGDLVGPYRVIREIGAGGMGSVWLAERADGAYKRTVALKLPHLSWSGDLAERLARERDILAGLEHPHIARLYDAGLDALGRPFLAMELVEGQAIDVYCRDRKLPIRERLALVLQVARAVAHAHSRLIVHRDLKPRNILVSADGAAHLLDFGIAKLLESDASRESPRTRFEGRALTPDYASPEQIRGEPVGTSTDVYSLAVVTYELLTESRPYRLPHRSAAELERTIAEIEPRLASEAAQDHSLKRQLRGDLDAILNKALKKDPRERYATVDAFAHDIDRYLSGIPVQARADSATYRFAKLVARNKGKAAAVAAVLVATLGGTAVALWQAREAASQARLASEQALRAEQQAMLANQQAKRADEVKRFVLSIFEKADIDAGGGQSTTAVDLLKSAQQRIEGELSDQPAVEVELLTSIGYSLIGLDQVPTAIATLQRAVSIGEERLPRPHRLTAGARVTLGEGLVDSGRFDEAEPVLTAAIADARRVDAPRELADALRWMSSLRARQGREDEALALGDEAVAIAESRLQGREQQLRMELYINQHRRWQGFGRPDAVIPAEKAYRLMQEIDHGATSLTVLASREQYATALADSGDLAGGIEDLKVTVDEMIKLVGRNHQTVAVAIQSLAGLQAARGDWNDAIESYRQALDSERALGTKGHERDIGLMRSQLGSALFHARREKEAEVEFRLALDSLMAGVGAQNRATLQARTLHALALARLGNLAASEAESRSLENPSKKGSRDHAYFRVRLGILRNEQGRFAEARELLDGAIADLGDEPRVASDDLARARGLNALAASLLATNNGPRALQLAGEAQRTFERLQPHGSPDLADSLLLQGRAQLAAGRREDAARAMNQAVAFWERFDPANRHAALARRWQERVIARQGATAAR